MNFYLTMLLIVQDSSSEQVSKHMAHGALIVQAKGLKADTLIALGINIPDENH